MKSVRQLLEETSSNHTVHLTVGKFEGVHAGHAAAINSVLSQETGKKQVLVTHTQDALRGKVFSPEEKISLLKKAYPNHKSTFVSTSAERPTLFHHLQHLHSQGVEHIHLHLGSDRIGKNEKKPETGSLGDNVVQGNGKVGKDGKGYNFKTITFHKVGSDRKEDKNSEDVDSASSSLMREHALNPDITNAERVNKVHKMMHTNLTKDDARDYVDKVQTRTGAARQASDKKMADKASARVAKKQAKNEEVEVGDFVTDGVVNGELISFGPNYANVVSEGIEFKVWLSLIEKVDIVAKRDQIFKESFIFKGYKSKNLSRELAEQFKDISKQTTDVYALLSTLKCCDYILGVNEDTIIENFAAVKVQFERAKRYTNKFNINITEQLKFVEENCLRYAIIEAHTFASTDKIMIARMIATIAGTSISTTDPITTINLANQKLRLEHLTTPGWKLMGRMLNVATQAGIRWNKNTFNKPQQDAMQLH